MGAAGHHRRGQLREPRRKGHPRSHHPRGGGRHLRAGHPWRHRFRRVRAGRPVQRFRAERGRLQPHGLERRRGTHQRYLQQHGEDHLPRLHRAVRQRDVGLAEGGDAVRHRTADRHVHRGSAKPGARERPARIQGRGDGAVRVERLPGGDRRECQPLLPQQPDLPELARVDGHLRHAVRRHDAPIGHEPAAVVPADGRLDDPARRPRRLHAGDGHARTRSRAGHAGRRGAGRPARRPRALRQGSAGAPDGGVACDRVPGEG